MLEDSSPTTLVPFSSKVHGNLRPLRFYVKCSYHDMKPISAEKFSSPCIINIFPSQLYLQPLSNANFTMSGYVFCKDLVSNLL